MEECFQGEGSGEEWVRDEGFNTIFGKILS